MSARDTLVAAVRAWADRYEGDLAPWVPEAMVDAYRAEVLAEREPEVERLRQKADRMRIVGLREAAEMVGNDDTCGCGGCDTCVPRALAAEVLAHADRLTTALGGTPGGGR